MTKNQAFQISSTYQNEVLVWHGSQYRVYEHVSKATMNRISTLTYHTDIKTHMLYDLHDSSITVFIHRDN